MTKKPRLLFPISLAAGGEGEERSFSSAAAEKGGGKRPVVLFRLEAPGAATERREGKTSGHGYDRGRESAVSRVSTKKRKAR